MAVSVFSKYLSQFWYRYFDFFSKIDRSILYKTLWTDLFQRTTAELYFLSNTMLENEPLSNVRFLELIISLLLEE